MEKKIKRVVEKYYDIGNIENIERIKRYGEVQDAFIVKTNKGKFFLKRYWKLNQNIIDGFKVISFLINKGYPCVKFIKNKYGNPYICYKKDCFAVFEFLREFYYRQQDEQPNLKKIYELGVYLGKLHKLTRNFYIKSRNFQDINYFRNSLRKNWHKLKTAPKRIREIYAYIKEKIELIKIPNYPRAVLHNEFTLEHVRFKKGKLIKVIDWDVVARDPCFYDYATAMISIFTNQGINFGFLKEFIGGYNKERKLTKKETKHIFDAILFGCFKFAIWNLEEVKKWKWHIDYERVKYVKENEEKIKKFLDELNFLI